MDVWALGVSIYAVIFGRIPFADRNEIKDKEPDFDLSVPSTHDSDKGDKISPECKACMAALLTKDPANRPSVTQAIEKFTWL